MSQKDPKNDGTCPVCWSTFKIQRDSGNLHKHGPRSNPCPGSNKPPIDRTQRGKASNIFHDSADVDHTGTLPTNVIITTESDTSKPTDEDTALTHPPWTRLINRIPRSARPSCAQLLTVILQSILKQPDKSTLWTNLLSFGSLILFKPRRGGSKRNLSNIINKRVAEWSKDDRPPSTVPTPRRLYSQQTPLKSLAAAVTSKVETGNFKAAIRILCSDDTVAPESEETLAALKGKHPEPSPLRRTPCDPTGNARFIPLQVDHNDVTKMLKTFPLGSTGGPDGLTPQHIKDLLSGDPMANYFTPSSTLSICFFREDYQKRSMK